MSVIHLIPCDQAVIRHILEGDTALAAFLQVQIPEKWTEFGRTAFQYTLKKIQENPEQTPWWSYLPILIPSNTLIGSCGFKGPPDEKGIVEIGYEVAPGFRNQGLATEVARLLVARAFEDPTVLTIQAHTLAERNASCRVLEKNGFQWAGTIVLGREGKLWKWVLNRPKLVA